MLFLFWVLLALAGSCLFLLMPALLGWNIYDRYRGVRMVTCPQTHGQVLVRFDALHAAFTGMLATEKLRLASCTLWPERMGCAQGCIGEAATFQSPLLRQQAREAGVGIHYPAVLGAIAVYWLINAVWYSHYLFRTTWMHLMGYSEEQVWQMVLRSVPQLATLAWSVFFTLVLARIIERNDRHGVWRGMEAGFLAWTPMMLAIVATVVRLGLPSDLVWIYSSSTLISSVAAGAILGTWTKGRILRALKEE